MAASQGFNYSGLSPAQQERLRQLADHIHSTGCQQTVAAVEIGKMLIEAKGNLHHGRFGQWCEHEAGYRTRKAQLLMNLTIFAIKEPDVLHIPVSAGYMLAAPAAPAHIVEKVLSRARDGGRVTVAWVEELFDGENEKEPRPERSNTSEVTKIAKLLANAIGPSQATTLRKLLEAAGASLIQHFVSDLQGQLRDKLHDTDPAASFNHAVHQPAVGL
jgi:plasmid stabilization system protein ParE